MAGAPELEGWVNSNQGKGTLNQCYCAFRNVGISRQSPSGKLEKWIFSKNHEPLSTDNFFLLVFTENHKYELDTIFYEVSENDHHLSDSLN